LQVSWPRQFAGEGRPQGIAAMPSSVWPSQSLSQPSQISGEGMQTPQTLLSSMIPSQSLSCPSQTSGLGQWRGLPHLVTPSSTPPTQLLSTLSQLSPGLKHDHCAGQA
jgi:hypothetical protein